MELFNSSCRMKSMIGLSNTPQNRGWIATSARNNVRPSEGLQRLFPSYAENITSSNSKINASTDTHGPVIKTILVWLLVIRNFLAAIYFKFLVFLELERDPSVPTPQELYDKKMQKLRLKEYNVKCSLHFLRTFITSRKDLCQIFVEHTKKHRNHIILGYTQPLKGDINEPRHRMYLLERNISHSKGVLQAISLFILWHQPLQKCFYQHAKLASKEEQQTLLKISPKLTDALKNILKPTSDKKQQALIKLNPCFKDIFKGTLKPIKV